MVGPLNHPVEGERWRTIKWLLKNRRVDLFATIGFIIIWRYWHHHRADRYGTHLNKSAMFGGRTEELPRPDLVGLSDIKYVHFKDDLDKLARERNESEKF